jgi:hypothetical protein
VTRPSRRMPPSGRSLLRPLQALRTFKRRVGTQRPETDLRIRVWRRRDGFNRNLITAPPGNVLWMLTGRDVYRTLVLERGWSSQKYQDWLADTLVRVLLVAKAHQIRDEVQKTPNTIRNDGDSLWSVTSALNAAPSTPRLRARPRHAVSAPTNANL